MSYARVSSTLKLLLREQYGTVDGSIPRMLQVLSERGADECWHKHSTFKQHLVGVWRILNLWDQRSSVCRAGLCHSAYSNSYVNLKIFDADVPSDRAEVKEVLGEEAEATILLWCTINRRLEVVDKLAAISKSNDRGENRAAALLAAVGSGMEATHLRTGEAIALDPRTVGELLAFEMADAADQQFGWQDDLLGGDFYADSGVQHPEALWPGSSVPGLWMSHLSHLGAMVKACADASALASGSPRFAVPPVFDGCTALLEHADERAARDQYWSVIASPASSASPAGRSAAIDALGRVSQRNPFIAEPYVVRAQLLLAEGDDAAAAKASAEGLRLLGDWGACWDKRMSWEAWVAWTRVINQRAVDGLGWPRESWEVINFGLVK